MISEKTMLARPNLYKQFIITTGALSKGIDATLSQLHNNKREI